MDRFTQFQGNERVLADFFYSITKERSSIKGKVSATPDKRMCFAARQIHSIGNCHNLNSESLRKLLAYVITDSNGACQARPGL